MKKKSHAMRPANVAARKIVTLVCEHGYTEPDSYCPECPNPKAKFVIQRPEYPDWFAGWSEHGGGACWTSNEGDAVYVHTDDLVATLAKLKRHKPIAALLSPPAAAQPNDKLCNPADSGRGAQEKESNV